MNESNNNQTAKRSYLLRPYREGGKIKCPRCGKKSFTPYIEGATRQVLDDSVGRCDHICSCAYHKTPKEYFEEDVTRGRRRLAYIYSQPIPAPKPVPDKVDLCSIEEWDQRQQPHWSLCADLISHMRRYFHSDKIERVVRKYHIQRYTPQRPYTMFPCIDIHGRVADVAVMEYNEDLHRGSTTFWYHGNSQWRERMAREHPNGYRFGSCFFGEHLLAEDPYSPVAVVESQKTALLGSIFLRGYIWLATCGCGRLNVNMCYRLKGRHVTLFPDKGMEDKWEAIANRVRSNNEQTTPDAHVDISVNRWMDHAPDKPDNTDIADIWMEIFFNIK
jgi:hypothetical protein